MSAAIDGFFTPLCVECVYGLDGGPPAAERNRFYPPLTNVRVYG